MNYMRYEYLWLIRYGVKVYKDIEKQLFFNAPFIIKL